MTSPLLSPQNLKLGAEKNYYFPGQTCKRLSSKLTNSVSSAGRNRDGEDYDCFSNCSSMRYFYISQENRTTSGEFLTVLESHRICKF